MIFLFIFNNLKTDPDTFKGVFWVRIVTLTVTLTVERFVLTYGNYLVRDNPIRIRSVGSKIRPEK